MSLDVYLNEPNQEYEIWEERKRIALAQAGEYSNLIQIVEKHFEDCQPFKYNEVYWANITHNLGKMAGEAGIYEAIWGPEEIGATTAGQLIEHIKKGLWLLKSDRERFEKFNSPNGWGLYENFVPWVEKYLKACIENPQAIVEVSR